MTAGLKARGAMSSGTGTNSGWLSTSSVLALGADLKLVEAHPMAPTKIVRVASTRPIQITIDRSILHPVFGDRSTTLLSPLLP